jgi:hypothetical protein
VEEKEDNIKKTDSEYLFEIYDLYNKREVTGISYVYNIIEVYNKVKSLIKDWRENNAIIEVNIEDKIPQGAIRVCTFFYSPRIDIFVYISGRWRKVAEDKFLVKECDLTNSSTYNCIYQFPALEKWDE